MSAAFDELIHEKLKLLMSDYVELENMIAGLSDKVKLEMVDAINEISALKTALLEIPKQFDEDFSRKMNRILDVALDIEVHSRSFNANLESSISEAIIDKTITISKDINKKIDKFSIVSNRNLIAYGLFSALVGGFVSGCMAWALIPMFF